MNDNDLITAVRESVTGVHTATPVEQIVSRGRALRARRRLPGAAGALAAAAAAAVTATALVPAGHHPTSPNPPAGLAAWTVVKQPDGDVTVTIRQLRDPAGLQSRLRADGVPATVTFSGLMSRSCQRYLAGPVLNQVFTSSGSARTTVMIIHPSALPPGAGVAINPPVQQALQVAVGLVHTSAQCTGT
jgi:hypothetical protein